MSLSHNIDYVWQGVELLSLQVSPNFVVFLLNDVEVEIVLITIQKTVDYVSNIGQLL